MIRPAMLAALLIITVPAIARDARLVTRAYDPAQIVRIEGRPNIQATIVFEPSEHIENVAIGDSSSWQVTPNKRANLLFVKPLSAHARTNMTVVTDKRSYVFDLVAGNAANPFYVLQFTYADQTQRPVQSGGGAALPLEFQAVSTASQIIPADPANLNFAWRSGGNSRLLPDRIYDDGQSTFIAWAAGTAIPAILIRNEKGEEGPVNFAVRGDVIVLDSVPKVILLRSGKSVATLEHRAPAPDVLASPSESK